VTVSVAAENFEIDGDPRAELVVSRAGQSTAVTFALRGQQEGPGRIMLDFTQNGRPVGSVNLSPAVGAGGRRPSKERAAGEGWVGLASDPPPAPDVVLKVFEYRHAGRPGRLHFVLSSTHPALQDLPVFDGDLGTLDLHSEVAAWVENQLRPLGEIASSAEARPEEVEKALGDIGNSLFEQLLPAQLQELSWTFRQRGVRTVLVLSDEPHIPWELVKPFRANPATGALEKVDEFWGEAFAMTHWLRGRPPVHQLACQRVVAMAAAASSATTTGPARDLGAVTLPAGGQEVGNLFLQAAEKELAVLRELETGGARVEVLPARRRELQQAFERGNFDLLHLACHGSFGGAAGADASAVQMEDGAFSAAELSPRLAEALRKASPLIFFNACHSGRVGFSLTRLGSWGARLVQLGCGGFVGALWPVTDQAALHFAEAFYRFLSGGAPIGEALTQARQVVRQRFPSDPTWLAYRCFADPLARLGKPAGHPDRAAVLPG
jgi:hypothetical protein